VILDPQLQIKVDQFEIAKDGFDTIVVHLVTNNLDSNDGSGENVVNGYHVKTTDKDYENVTYLGVLPTTDEEGTARVSSRQICDILDREFSLHHIMVEGGPNTALQFLKEGMVDRAILVHAPVTFKNPLPSTITPAMFEQAGLVLIGSYTLGVDSIECYSRPHIPWPSDNVSSWP